MAKSKLIEMTDELARDLDSQVRRESKTKKIVVNASDVIRQALVEYLHRERLEDITGKTMTQKGSKKGSVNSEHRINGEAI
jgi:Arc/MetJ-type ribon-helix-helix transcriptional regulator